jgi:hypothetical protein
MDGDEDVINSDAYAYSNELLVELTCRDADDHLVVHSYPCEVENGVASPHEPVVGEHLPAVREAVREHGYELDL